MLFIRKSDAKGRITLGLEYAEQTFIVEAQEGGHILLKKAVIMSEKEAKQYKVENKNIKKVRGVVAGIYTTVIRDKKQRI